MHTGEPLFGGIDSQDQIYKISCVVGLIPDSLVERADKQKTSKYFTEKSPDAECTLKYRMKTPSQYARPEDGGFLDKPSLKSLRTIIGVDMGGPSGRRNGENGHSLEHYEAFSDFIERMLRIVPEERISPQEALAHPFLLPPLWTRSAADPGSDKNV
jgi:dual specificity tyrosine-phosphorylation-regulated kinase 1